MIDSEHVRSLSAHMGARTDGEEVALGNLAIVVSVIVLENLLHLGLLHIESKRAQGHLHLWKTVTTPRRLPSAY